MEGERPKLAWSKTERLEAKQVRPKIKKVRAR